MPRFERAARRYVRTSRGVRTYRGHRGHRGRPVWQALALLMLLPLAAATIMGGSSVVAANRAADDALRAQRLVAAVEFLDTARRATDAEVLPTILLRVLQDEQRSVAAGFNPARRALLKNTVPATVSQLRTATNDALAAAGAAPDVPQLEAVASQARRSLDAIRSAADSGVTSLGVVADGYTRISGNLASAQRAASAQAISAGLGTRSVGALQDLNQVLQLSETASRQLGELFASRVLTEPAAGVAQRRWVAAWGTFTELANRSKELSTESTREAWAVFESNDAAQAFTEILTRQAHDPAANVLETGALPGLVHRSRLRDDALAIVLQDAATAVTASARADRAAAVSRERTTLGICLALLLLSLLDAVLVGRWLATSMRLLAGSARKVSQGHLVDIEARGPRELRTAALALSSSVAGLRRLQEQASAVVAGDPGAALRQEPLPGPLGDVVHASVEQIVDALRARQELQDELAHQASHDPLTGLSNRAETLRHLAAALEAGHRSGHRTGVLFIDLDGFKAVNDTHGHAAGDEVLREVAERLTGAVRPEDVVGRLGGDEFVVTVQDVDGASDLVDLGRRLVDAVTWSGHVSLNGALKQVRIGASVGASVSSDESTADSLLAEADVAAYRAKHRGRGRVEVFDEALRTELAERADLEAALRRGLEAGEVHLTYQPLVNLTSGRLIGYEALARWTRPGVGLVSPDVFIAAAEASTFVCDLGRWVLAAATTQVADWRARRAAGFCDGPGDPTIAVNISGRHLADPRVLSDVQDALSRSALPPKMLVLEITETVLTDERAEEHLRELRRRGVRVAIDDFGTGFTSIGALSRTPADIVKIDRSFVGSDDGGHHQLATLITRAAHTFSLRVVAEGVETPEQLARVQADGCDEAQGYLFSRPLPPEALERLPHTEAFLGARTAKPTDRFPTPRWSTT